MASVTATSKFAEGFHSSEQLHPLAHNFGTWVRRLALLETVEQGSLTTLHEKKLVKTGAKIVRHGRYVVFQMAEVAVPTDRFADILRCIDQLRRPPVCVAPRTGQSTITAALQRSGDANGLRAHPFKVSFNPSGEVPMGNPG